MNFDETEMRELIAARVAEEFSGDSDIRCMIERNIDARIEKLFAERANTAITAAIDAAVSDGFDRTYQAIDSFGTPQGQPTTIRKELNSLIGNYWSQQVGKDGKPTSSGYNTTSRAEYLMTQICAKDFTDQMKQAAVSVTAALKDGFRAQLAKHVDGLLDELFRVKSLQDQGKATKPW